MSNVITAVTDVFTAIGSWIVETLPSIVEVFYNAETGLTFLGILAVVALGVSIFLLLMNIITNFLQFRA